VDVKLRNLFDSHLEQVLAGMPQRVHDLLAEVPLHVEDYPSQQVLQDLGLSRCANLCGVYTGVPLDQRVTDNDPAMPDVVTIFREGIIQLAAGDEQQLSVEELRKQIRITLLHELGHHHGLSEAELTVLGYD
jgi:predicted Zn-dependent protease with MMP-like domain